MLIISKTAQENGSYAPIQTWGGLTPPSDCYGVLDWVDTDVFSDYNGFVNLTVRRGWVSEITPNEEAWEAWKKTDEAKAELILAQDEKQLQNKTALADWLNEHPLQWTDGKYYGVTQEDQNEMSLNLMQYTVATQAAQPEVILEWHAQKESCRTFTLEEFTALSIAIKNYVYPYLRYQEKVKEQIYAAETIKEVNAVEINYADV